MMESTRMLILKSILSLLPIVFIFLSIKFYVIPAFLDFGGNLVAKTEPRDEITRVEDPVDKKVSERREAISEEVFKNKLKDWMPDKEIKRIISEDLKSNYINYKEDIEAALYKLETRSDEDIWKHAIEQTPWFVERFYSERDDDKFYKEMMRQYLLPSDEVLERYQRIVIKDAVRAIEQILDKIARSHLDKIKLDKSNTKLPFSEDDLLKHLKELLPTADEVIQSIYKGMEIDGHNSTYNNKYLELYKTFELENPGVSISMKSFAVLLVLLAAPGSVILPLVILTTISSTVIFRQERLEYEKELLKKIYAVRTKYNDQVEYFMWTLFNGVIGYIQNDEFVVNWEKR